ncbi:hypothetical protein L208DRAFT_681094 [Tricholoma matsutake]|nr:hypothetical protein L208DRAFT_681094 [Tricholoma matsutake 945]
MSWLFQDHHNHDTDRHEMTKSQLAVIDSLCLSTAILTLTIVILELQSKVSSAIQWLV